jgi:hypothetical protein
MQSSCRPAFPVVFANDRAGGGNAPGRAIGQIVNIVRTYRLLDAMESASNAEFTSPVPACLEAHAQFR